MKGLLLCYIGLALSAGLSLHWIMRLEKERKTRVWSLAKALSLSPSLEYFIWKLLYFPILVVFKAGSEALPLDGLSREAKVLSRQTSLPPTHPHPKNSRQTYFSTNKTYPLHPRKKVKLIEYVVSERYLGFLTLWKNTIVHKFSSCIKPQTIVSIRYFKLRVI